MAGKNLICVQTGNWYDKRFGGDAHADEAFAFIKSCGFNAVDFNIDQTMNAGLISRGERNTFYDASLEELLELYRPVREAALRHGVAISSGHGLFPMIIDGKDDLNDYIIMATEKIIAIMAYIGCHALIVHPACRNDKAHEWEINMAMYRRLIPAAKQYGVKICLENIPSHNGHHVVMGCCCDVQEACRYIDTLNAEAGEDVFGFCFDIGHANNTCRILSNDIRTLGKRLTTLHIHDNDAASDLHLIPYTQKRGAVDWEDFIAGLRDIGYEGPLNFETFAGVDLMPQEIGEAALRFIAAIGRYFASRLDA